MSIIGGQSPCNFFRLYFNTILKHSLIIKFFNTIPSAEELLEHINNDEPNNCADEAMMYEVAYLYYNYGEQEKAKEILKRIQNGFLKDRIQKFANHAGIIL
ncbi:hypothetical protein [Clostridium beijerinckii]|uniref:hypothetical protein n=1 Tax=Clostridium beijerinckii TaxID=1520 RepID=UPI0022E8312B|nr:hypothetical protein [Clostridium beijerinckii]